MGIPPIAKPEGRSPFGLSDPDKRAFDLKAASIRQDLLDLLGEAFPLRVGGGEPQVFSESFDDLHDLRTSFPDGPLGEPYRVFAWKEALGQFLRRLGSGATRGWFFFQEIEELRYSFSLLLFTLFTVHFSSFQIRIEDKKKGRRNASPSLELSDLFSNQLLTPSFQVGSGLDG
jgi:hypothetical protein